ncbi:fimbria/pilus outer membrane usher protein [Acinetobacter ihumii]|uniref:fimbria/pilus outer membrane usher protein n=1 Tax=Acinetobacter ihumii TaxID=2483802 RepID=UPI001030685D|nr:fimbria/pilus outer membrane usher protein [Acinetobacter ihumii]
MRNHHRFNSSLILSICLLSGTMITQLYAAEDTSSTNHADEYYFDRALFRGQSIQQAGLMQRLSQKQVVLAGKYKVDVYVNGRFIERMQLEFKETADDVQPCFNAAMLKSLGLVDRSIPNTAQSTLEKQCVYLSEQVKGSQSQLDFSQLRLNLTIPQSELRFVPRGYVDPSQWNAGSSIGFVNYIANYYYNSYRIDLGRFNQDAAYLSLTGGINFGKWQYRQQSSISYDKGRGTDWNNIRSYVVRALPAIRGQATFGQVYSSGQFFSGLSFTGLNISSDDRMLPESVRGYAPVVQGVAKTNAKVSVQQNGREIYQTSVAPGSFKITDLYPTNYNGDLTVIVYEADGSMSQFRVPFSAVPESLRMGSYRYNFDIGRSRDIGEDTYFSNVTYQRGLSNAVTLNSGLRIADGYQAALLGGNYTSFLGAFGSNLTYSHADLDELGSTDGWLASLTYSKTIQPTNTNIALAGYRYSTEGYRDLGDVIGLRYALNNGETWQSSSYLQRSRVELTLNQSLGDYGILFISGSTQDYRDGRDRDVQTQIGYNKAFKNGVSMNLSLIRQENSYYQLADSSNNPVISPDPLQDKKKDTTLSLSLNLPLGGQNKTRPPYLGVSYSHSSDQSDFYQAMLSGTLSKDQSFNYAVGVSHDQDMNNTTWNGNLNKRFSNLTAGLSASTGEDFWQASANAQGAIAIHSGGITFGPYLGETFALVEAKGAEGAKVFNGQGSSINKSGYALVPAITAYRYNTISLDPQGISEQVEIESSEQQIAPYAGAAVKIKFKTRTGYPLLVQARLDNAEKDYVPLGSEVLDEQGNVIGMVGQSGQMYVRAEQRQGALIVRWGEQNDQHCRVQYHIDDQAIQQTLIRFEQSCQMEQVK